MIGIYVACLLWFGAFCFIMGLLVGMETEVLDDGERPELWVRDGVCDCGLPVLLGPATLLGDAEGVGS